LKARPNAQRKAAGFHAELICLTPWVNGEAPSPISCVALNTAFGIMAYGNGSGLAVVDVEQGVCLLNMGTADLYGCMDPFQRMPRSPKPLLSSSGAPEIVRMDLGNYSQVGASTPSGEVAPGDKQASPSAEASKGKDTIALPKPMERVKSPDCRRLQQIGKAGSSTDENSMSKSQSSSANSLDQVIAQEGITSVYFADTFTSKNDFSLNPSLYVGTTLGSLIAIVVNLPEAGEPRQTEPVVVSPSGSLYRQRGAVLALSFLDVSTGGLTARGKQAVNVRVPPKSPAPGAALSQQASQEDKGPPAAATGDQQIAVVCTEKMAAVYALPSQRQMYSQTINESSSPVVSASVVNFGGSRYTPVLATYTADGFIKAYSLPSLRPLVDRYFVAKTTRVERTFRLSDYGHGLYFCNGNELQKFTMSADFLRQLPEMQGQAWRDAIPDPEPPSKGFLKGLLWGSGPKPLDREELFGETAGKVAASTATHIPGAAMASAQGKGAMATSEVGQAKMKLVERGQKLSEIEDRTEAMANEAKVYAANARKLMLASKEKKWYQ